MDGISEFLQLIQRHGLAAGRLRGVFHLAIGRRIETQDGRVIVNGVTWRDLAAALKHARFDKELVRELGLDPDTLAPRDRLRMWYLAIAHAQVDGPRARAEADSLAKDLERLNIRVGPAPGSGASRRSGSAGESGGQHPPSSATAGQTESAPAESPPSASETDDSSQRRPGKKK